MDAMVDLETLDTVCTAVILQIGAVKYDLATGEISDEFLVNVDPKDCKKYGLTISQDTLDWWSNQSKEVRDSLLVDQMPLRDALTMFSDWFDADSYFTCYGASFDEPILANAYRKVGLVPPWKFWNVRCARTIGELYDTKPIRGKDHHNALADAKAQTEMLLSIFTK